MGKRSFGVLTMAVQDDYLKAIGLSLSFKLNNGDIPISIVCNKKIKNELSGYFDSVIIEKDNVHGFQHKIFLDEYSPYTETLFLDADMLVFKSVMIFIKKWKSYPYIAQGRYSTEGVSSFGLETKQVLKMTSRNKMPNISGAGHSYFKKPECNHIFLKAREIMNDYESYGKNLRFADEDIMNIAMSMCDYPVYERRDFMAMPGHASKNTLKIDILKQDCRLFSRKYGRIEPCVLHFAARQYPFMYLRELIALYKNAGIYNKFRNKLFKSAILDYWTTKFEWNIKRLYKKSLNIFKK